MSFRALCIVFSAVSLLGQSTGRLTGSVADPSGAAVPNATVDLLLTDGAKPLVSTVTTSQGLFTIANIRPATYKLAISAKAFSTYHAARVVIDASRETSLAAIRLDLASAATSLQVTEDIETVQTANAEASTTISTKQISRLPILDRDVVSLISTQPGVADNGLGETVINGQRSSFSNVTLDGINIQDNYIRTGGLDFQPNLLLMDQVSEFTIVSSNGNSSLGGGASQVNLVTPSGTNEFHGKTYWYNRNNYFAANAWFDNADGNPRPFLNQNQLGVSFGGPIRRDKLFFYTNYEAVRTREQTEVDQTVLTASARQGLFTYVDKSGKLQQVNVLTAAGIKADPVMAQMLALVPGPEKINNFRTGDSSAGQLLNTAGYAFNQQSNRDRDNVTGRLDYILSPKNNFSASYAWNRDHVDRGDAATNFNAVPEAFNDDQVNFFSAGWRWNPFPAITNELHAGFNVAPAIFATSTKYPAYFIDGTSWSNPINEFQPQGRHTATYQLGDAATWVHGRHTLQFGFQAQKIYVRTYDFASTVPDYVVATGTRHAGLTAGKLPGITQSDLDNANTLLASLGGLIDSASEVFNVTSQTAGFVPGAPYLRHFRLSNYAGYGMDTWKFMPRFTITLGMRYEYFTPTTEANSLSLQPVLQNNNPITTLLNPNGALDYAGGSNRPYYNAYKKNFAPQFGFAWDIFGNGKTALRGGYSIHYVNDEAIISVENNASGTNSGLVGNASLVSLPNTASNLPAIAPPVFQIPRTYADNYNDSSFSAVGLIDHNLRNPYVQEWSVGLQQNIKGTILEARYVGNHGLQELRAFDFNQVLIDANGFLADFKRAQSNGFLAEARNGVFNPNYNRSIAGSQPLTVFPLLSSGGYLTDSTVDQYISEGQVGELAAFYQYEGINGKVNFFQNYNSLGTNYLTNFSNSTYNALQIDVRHRVETGLYLQANYTFSKVLSDSDGNTQERFDPFLNVYNGSLERARAPFDITHVFHLNASYDLPFGKGHRFGGGKLARALGGWSISTVTMYQSGAPFSIISGRGTFNRSSSGRSRYNTVNSIAGGDALSQVVSFRMTGSGPYIVGSGAIAPDGRGVASDGAAPFTGQVFFNPPAGTVGTLQRRMFDGPNVFNMNASLIKNTRITEHQSLEFRIDAFNALNHPAFFAGDQFVNSTTFGQANGTVNDRRVIQFGLHYEF